MMKRKAIYTKVLTAILNKEEVKLTPAAKAAIELLTDAGMISAMFTVTDLGKIYLGVSDLPRGIQNILRLYPWARWFRIRQFNVPSRGWIDTHPQDCLSLERCNFDSKLAEFPEADWFNLELKDQFGRQSARPDWKASELRDGQNV